MDVTVEQRADAWIELYKLGPGLAAEELVDRGFQLNHDAYDNPSFAWRAITEIVCRFEEDALFTDGETDAKRVLANLGAGPLECLLAQHGPEFIEAVEAEARRDRRFFWTLGCVWQNAASDDIWARVQAATGRFSP